MARKNRRRSSVTGRQRRKMLEVSRNTPTYLKTLSSVASPVTRPLGAEANGTLLPPSTMVPGLAPEAADLLIDTQSKGPNMSLTPPHVDEPPLKQPAQDQAPIILPPGEPTQVDTGAPAKAAFSNGIPKPFIFPSSVSPSLRPGLPAPLSLSVPTLETITKAFTKNAALLGVSKGTEGKAGENTTPTPDFERLSRNLAKLTEQAGKVLATYFKPMEQEEIRNEISSEVGNAVRSIGRIAEHWLKDPARRLEAQNKLVTPLLMLCTQTLWRFSGEAREPVVPVNPADKRFSAPEWRESPFFDFLRQAHAIIVNWIDDLINNAEGVDQFAKDKAKYYVRQITSALSPSNFLATNPELLRETLASNGENLVRGVSLFTQDLEAGKGKLKISQTDMSKFTLGVNIATTPGKVVFRNELIELIQYSPTTDEVYKRPLLIVPPWINKFYILDLNPEKSFVSWAVSQGLTVFMISWVNPDERHRNMGFEAYMHRGLFAALTAIRLACGEEKITTIGYCIGGTLLSMALAYMAATGDDRIESASFFTTQTDFSEAGDLRLLIDPEQLQMLEQKMAQHGYLEAEKMAHAFNSLRPTDLIWSYVVNNYLKGQPPKAFDLLAWNSDPTRMPAANYLFYLRELYLNNRLTKGEIAFDGHPLNLARVKIPIYHLATREDHIAPARSVFLGAKFFGGDIRFVVAGSGHIAGVINPANKPKYQYWTGCRPEGNFDAWFANTKEHPGSWWPDWLNWVAAQAPAKVKARIPGEGQLPAITDAPGDYVKVRY
ncbi:PHA/PHB synthase family protein [Beijerinckia indica]|uniref:Poly(R)-hydroxyalkanoic acid synthase, class I n=1 Tax=Beijerinckia indica subsp. indica (strain ATCC 9039 / DSM 1715 / NCIMB 8712) TaxID=395963 RepID=B2IK89_BEII9|nr:class I poly(R)-hydroxyalkanoic acid synthase [Beijerinckia indica]ACB95021.1 poly(R)-hydroxyalkanoic acid synthase, class I [Beijerinckia indica subsp. indica ATCC 9039]